MALCMAGALAMTPVFGDTGIFASNVINVQAASNVDISWYKEGEKEFILNSAAQLRGLAELVNGTEENPAVSFEGCTIKLENDIDLNNMSWTPIGNVASTPFKGSFDGQGHSISNLFISKEIPREETVVPEIYAGLFGYIQGTSPELRTSIKDIKLKNIDVAVTHEGGEDLQRRNDVPAIGGLIGESRNADITACTIEDGKIVSEVGCVGGLVGSAIAGDIKKCNVKADVKSTILNFWLGGIAGSISNGNAEFLTYEGTVSGCAEKVAGISGNVSKGNVSDCITKAGTKIKVTSTQAYTAGITTNLDLNQKVERCVNNAEISFEENINPGMAGGIICFTTGGGLVEKCINYGVVSGGTVAGIVAMKIPSNEQLIELNYCANYGKITGKFTSGAIAVNSNSNKKPAIVKNSYTLDAGLENQIVDNNKKLGASYINVYYDNDNGVVATPNGEIEGVTGYTAAQFKDRTVVDALNANDGVEETVWYQNTENPDLAFNMTVTSDITVPETLNVTLGKTMKLQASVIPEDATNKTLVYTSSDDTIASVKEDGTVSGLKLGTADITVKAMDTGKEKTVKVTVKEAEKEPANPTNPAKPSQPTTQKKNPTVAIVKKGTKLTAGTNTFVVTNVKAKTVSYTGTKNKKAAKVTVPATVKAGKQVYKVTAIADNAFKNNKKVKTVVVGKNVTTIGKKAFYGCKNLKKITVQSTVLKKVGANAFKGINKKATIKVPSKKYKAYKKVLKGKGQAKTVTIKK